MPRPYDGIWICRGDTCVVLLLLNIVAQLGLDIGNGINTQRKRQVAAVHRCARG
jgi:hypothetical protein